MQEKYNEMPKRALEYKNKAPDNSHFMCNVNANSVMQI